jgi:hypothetical protein
MIAGFSVFISIIALGFSFFAFFEGRRKDQRDIFLQIHQLLISDDLRRGRYLIRENYPLAEAYGLRFKRVTNDGRYPPVAP